METMVSVMVWLLCSDSLVDAALCLRVSINGVSETPIFAVYLPNFLSLSLSLYGNRENEENKRNEMCVTLKCCVFQLKFRYNLFGAWDESCYNRGHGDLSETFRTPIFVLIYLSIISYHSHPFDSEYLYIIKLNQTHIFRVFIYTNFIFSSTIVLFLGALNSIFKIYFSYRLGQ